MTFDQQNLLIGDALFGAIFLAGGIASARDPEKFNRDVGRFFNQPSDVPFSREQVIGTRIIGSIAVLDGLWLILSAALAACGRL